MIIVRLYPCSDVLHHTSKILAGLFELADRQEIAVQILTHRPRTLQLARRTHPTQQYRFPMEVSDSESGPWRRIIFDMHDNGSKLDVSDVENSDTYFKRSFDPKALEALPPNLRNRVVPYGLKYTCHSRRALEPAKLLAVQNACILRSLGADNCRSLSRFMKFYVTTPVDLLRNFFLPNLFRKTTLPSWQSFECDPEQHRQKFVLFQTRVWDPSRRTKHVPKLEEMNRQRADVVRALKDHFGDRFRGGLIHTPYAREKYSDLLLPNPNNAKSTSFQQSVRAASVVVTTDGLFGSIGSKVAEFLAASQCIVMERPKYELPYPLKRDSNYVEFETPDECVDACASVLDSTARSQSMRRDNWEYYEKYVRPATHLGLCLKLALSHSLTV